MRNCIFSQENFLKYFCHFYEHSLLAVVIHYADILTFVSFANRYTHVLFKFINCFECVFLDFIKFSMIVPLPNFSNITLPEVKQLFELIVTNLMSNITDLNTFFMNYLYKIRTDIFLERFLTNEPVWRFFIRNICFECMGWSSKNRSDYRLCARKNLYLTFRYFMCKWYRYHRT